MTSKTTLLFFSFLQFCYHNSPAQSVNKPLFSLTALKIDHYTTLPDYPNTAIYTPEFKLIIQIDTSLGNIEMPKHTFIAKNTDDFIYPFDESYLWYLQEIQYYNLKYSEWTKPTNGNFYPFDVCLGFDPTLETSVLAKDSTSYFIPSYPVAQDIPFYNNLYRTRFHVRFIYREATIILTSNWMDL